LFVLNVKIIHSYFLGGAMVGRFIGAAIVPVPQAVLADLVGVQPAFVLPIFCYLYVAYYGLIGSKAKNKKLL